ncbi:hypothetical protein COOONC_01210 [Cooperia oncophora]
MDQYVQSVPCRNNGVFHCKITRARTVEAKTLDNRLIDVPKVTCGPDAIRVKGESEDVFEGQIFIKNQRRSTDCFVVYSAEENSTTPEFTLSLTRLSSCGIDIRRNNRVLRKQLVNIKEQHAILV